MTFARDLVVEPLQMRGDDGALAFEFGEAMRLALLLA